MGKIGKCCCDECPDIGTLPDWEIDGFTHGEWAQYGECCWSRTYTRIDMVAGIQIHFQDLYKRSIIASVDRDYYGWWVRENWVPNGPPPVGSLYATPMPNTCWNPYGLIGTLTYETELEENARQEAQFQITSVFVTVHKVFNSCTEETEYYVRVSPTIRISNRINAISYSRYEMTSTLDTCYEHAIGGPYSNVTGTKTFATLLPSWTTSVTPASVYKYNSIDDIPETLSVDISESPIDPDDECFDGHVCRPFYALPWSMCYSPPTYTAPAAYEFLDTLSSVTDNCILSSIRILTGLSSPWFWSVCDTLDPGVIPSPFGDMFVRYCTNSCFLPNAPGCGTSGVGAANSSVSSCSPLTYNTLSASTILVDASYSIIRRRASCSPLDLIACGPYVDWWYGSKTYPVTSSFRDLTHTKSRNVYSVAPLCMSPRTFDLVA